MGATPKHGFMKWGQARNMGSWNGGKPETWVHILGDKIDFIIFTFQPNRFHHFHLSSLSISSFSPFNPIDVIIFTFQPYRFQHFHISTLSISTCSPFNPIDFNISTFQPYHFHLSTLSISSFSPFNHTDFIIFTFQLNCLTRRPHRFRHFHRSTLSTSTFALCNPIRIVDYNLQSYSLPTFWPFNLITFNICTLQSYNIQQSRPPTPLILPFWPFNLIDFNSPNPTDVDISMS